MGIVPLQRNVTVQKDICSTGFPSLPFRYSLRVQHMLCKSASICILLKTPPSSCRRKTVDHPQEEPRSWRRVLQCYSFQSLLYITYLLIRVLYSYKYTIFHPCIHESCQELKEQGVFLLLCRRGEDGCEERNKAGGLGGGGRYGSFAGFVENRAVAA